MDLNAIYRSLPRSLQNVALTLYGYKQYGLRYGQALPEPYSRRDLHGALPFAEVRRWQQARFAELVAHAAEYVPYYRDLFAARGIEPATLTLDNFREHIPVLSKREVVAEPTRFHSTYFRSGAAMSLFTSGTSGSPMPIRCALQARAINYSFYRSLLAQHGCDVRDRSATFAGRLLLGDNDATTIARKDFYNRTLYLSSYHINERNMPAYLRALEEWQPQYIDSYPSAVALVAEHIVRNKVRHAIRPKFVLTSSETLTAPQREAIGAAFDCPVVDHYGCTEMAVSASGTGGRYRVDELYALVEFAPASAPGSRQLVCTGLLNFAMPLLRYAIGDVVNGAEEPAATPFYDQTFAEIAGREDDVIVTSDGRAIGRMDPVFKGLSGISQAQIIQRAPAEIEVLVVAAADADRAGVTATLAHGIRQRTAADMQVAVRFVETIPLTKSGKFKSVVSLLPKAPVAESV